MFGPPPSAAGPSKRSASSPTVEQESSTTSPKIVHASQSPQTTDTDRLPHGTARPDLGTTQSNPDLASGVRAAYNSSTSYWKNMPQSYSYHNYDAHAWGNAWNTTTYPYPNIGAFHYPPSQNLAVPGTQSTASPNTNAQVRRGMTPPPSPQPEIVKDWDTAITSFLSSAGMTQALHGFNADLIVMSPDWEQKKIPAALDKLLKDLSRIFHRIDAKPQENSIGSQEPHTDRPLELRKLDYVRLANGAEPRSQTSITKSVSRFLAQNRARNDASNRSEFLQSLAEKRRRLNENSSDDALSSCARTDAKTQDRDVQMKYDIAKNEDGPLRRTLRNGSDGPVNPREETKSQGGNMQEVVTAERSSASDERLRNLEAHLAIHYVPSPPRSFIDRLRFLEDHIISLEKDYPPWAALHFNQPNRGWPPPPRSTPIIVPSHLTSPLHHENSLALNAVGSSSVRGISTASTVGVDNTEASFAKGKGRSGRTNKSSLHRAVMEKLEVQKAMNDLAGVTNEQAGT